LNHLPAEEKSGGNWHNSKTFSFCFMSLVEAGAAFAAGILSENDIDYQLARLLAAEIVTTPAFEPVSEEALARAASLIETCERVILTDFPIGSGNERIRELAEQAENTGKLERR
jgi:iron complex transport system ATP-binding protein